MKTRAFYFLFVCTLLIAIFALYPPAVKLSNQKVFKDEYGFTHSYYYNDIDVEKVFSMLSFEPIFEENIGNTAYYYGISPLGRTILTQDGKRYNCQIAIVPDKIKFGFPLA